MKTLQEFIRENSDYDKLVLEPFLESNKISKEEWVLDSYDNHKEISEQEFYITKYNDFDLYNVPTYNIWQSYLYERLSDSLAISNDSILISMINKIPGIVDANMLPNNKWILELKYDDSFNVESEELNHLLAFYNYSISKIDELHRTIRIEANKPEQVKYTKPFLYHVTNSKAWGKIKKIGLIPKAKYYVTGNFSHPQRLYFFDSVISLNELKQWGRMFALAKGNDPNDVVILKVECHSLKLFKDPMFDPNSKILPYFTLEPIRTKFITKVENI